MYLLDYVANTLYPRQIHVYESFGEASEASEMPEASPEEEEKQEPGKRLVLEKEEEQIFQEVLSDFLGSST